jgi:competence protein ComFB
MSIRTCNVINANYERVLIVMDRFLTDKSRVICSCPRCTSDIAAIALNYLPPHYIVKGNKGKDCGSPWIMIETAVTEAIDRVIEKPNHPRMDNCGSDAS